MILKWNPITDPRSNWCCRRSTTLQNLMACLLKCGDILFRKVIGSILYLIVYGLVSFAYLTTVGIVIPYESLWMPWPILIVIPPLALYLVINIIFNYHMASVTPSGRPPKSTCEPLCWKCNNHKDINTHHCSMCGECVVHMDHHCVWINRCVGAGNHRYFIQFLAFLTISCFLYCTLGFSTFFNNYWKPRAETAFCYQDLEESFFWISTLCSYGDGHIESAIFFSFCLCMSIFSMVGCLFLWNVLLISSGSSYIALLKGNGGIWTWKEFFFPWLKPNFAQIWIDFLNLHHGRTFWRHIALPSTHRPMIPLDWGDKPSYENKPLIEV